MTRYLTIENHLAELIELCKSLPAKQRFTIATKMLIHIRKIWDILPDEKNHK